MPTSEMNSHLPTSRPPMPSAWRARARACPNRPRRAACRRRRRPGEQQEHHADAGRVERDQRAARFARAHDVDDVDADAERPPAAGRRRRLPAVRPSAAAATRHGGALLRRQRAGVASRTARSRPASSGRAPRSSPLSAAGPAPSAARSDRTNRQAAGSPARRRDADLPRSSPKPFGRTMATGASPSRTSPSAAARSSTLPFSPSTRSRSAFSFCSAAITRQEIRNEPQAP